MNYKHVILILLSMNVAYSSDIDNSAEELINNFAKSLSYQERYSSDISIVREIRNHDNTSLIGNIHKDKYVFQRIDNKTRLSGTTIAYNKDNEIYLNEYKIMTIANDTEYVHWQDIGVNSPVALMTRMQNNVRTKQKALLFDPTFGSPLFGRMSGSDTKDIVTLLKEGEPRVIKKDIINGISCILVSTVSRYGTVCAWIAPSKGYNAVKWSIAKGSRDYLNSVLLSEYCTDWYSEFTVNKFDEISGNFVIAEATYKHMRELKDKSKIESLYTYLCSNINLNFDDEDVFKVSLPDDTRIYLEEAPTVSYVWKDGRLVTYVPQDYLRVLDKKIDNIKENIANEKLDESISENNNRKILTTAETTQINQIEGDEQPAKVIVGKNTRNTKALMVILFVVCLVAVSLFFVRRIKK